MPVARRSTSWLLGAAAVLFAFPIVLMLLTSLKSSAQIDHEALFSLPHHPDLSAWRRAWSSACIGQTCSGISGSFVNSLLIVVPSLIISIVLGAAMGLSLYLSRSAVASFAAAALLFCLFIPAQATLLPVIVVLRELRLFGTRSGLICAHVFWGLPFVALLFRNAFRSIPRNIIDAARIDDLGRVTIFWRIMLPLSFPIWVAGLALQFTFVWNDYIFGLLLSGRGNEPVTVALNVLASPTYGQQEYNVNMAAALLASVPPLLVYAFSAYALARWTASRPLEESREATAYSSGGAAQELRPDTCYRRPQPER